MKYNTFLTKIGGSYWLKVPREIKDELNLNEKDEMLIDLKKVVGRKNQIQYLEDSLEIKSYLCLECQNTFESADEVPYCSICGNESTLKEVIIQEVKGGEADDE